MIFKFTIMDIYGFILILFLQEACLSCIRVVLASSSRALWEDVTMTACFQGKELSAL